MGVALRSVLLLSALQALAQTIPDVVAKRQVTQLRDQYDFVILGGGTAGLTVADRLSEAFPRKTVLVVEYGEIEYGRGYFDPPQVEHAPGFPGASSWVFNSLPNPHVANKTAKVVVGKVVGGSSCVNGQFFDRGSRHDFDVWDAATGIEEFDRTEHRWNWEGIFPYFRKSVTFTEPPETSIKAFGYTWDDSVYGGTTPIHSSFPPFQWADLPIVLGALKELDIPTLQECAGGDKAGICWVPTSQHPTTSRRSHSGLGHYAAVNTTRDNYDLLVRHQALRVLYPDGQVQGGRPPLVEVRSLPDGQVFNVTAKLEVIISAGALHTPTILHRSGFGPADILQKAGISTLVDLPGVGANLQDHAASIIQWNYTKPLDLSPLPADMYDPAFIADATAGFNETPARGPYTIAMRNNGIYIPLANMTADFESIITTIKQQLAKPPSDNAALYLPPDVSTSPAMVAGYQHQLALLLKLLEEEEEPSLEVPFGGGTSLSTVNLHPFSRGSVRLNATHPLEQPVLDYRGGSNPVDIAVLVAHLRYMRRIVDTPTLQAHGAVEIAPGANVTTTEQLAEYARNSVQLSLHHPCCTAAMLPRELGGVVGKDLKVHGADGLRVVDNSVALLLPSSHTSSLAYAIGEKAADIIIQEWAQAE
ncbi:GMC oxidoreductase-like protein [Apiospora arundinis]|uniref:GMC oxidoreductase-like protein n=1 Tax=Apiospora arundinis TaxID=335852 RepID=A0ABR2HT16_9PEZI